MCVLPTPPLTPINHPTHLLRSPLSLILVAQKNYIRTGWLRLRNSKQHAIHPSAHLPAIASDPLKALTRQSQCFYKKLLQTCSFVQGKKTKSRSISLLVLLHSSLRLRNNALILSRRDVIERPLEVLARVLKTRSVFIGVEIRMDELDEAVQVLGRDLFRVKSANYITELLLRSTYGLILLVKVVDVAVEDLNEELHTDRGIHTGVSHPQRTLQALKHTLAITVEL